MHQLGRRNSEKSSFSTRNIPGDQKEAAENKQLDDKSDVEIKRRVKDAR